MLNIVIAQINPRLGDFEYNCNKILDTCKSTVSKAKKEKLKPDLIVFPELSLLSYPPFDLLERPEILKEQNKFLKKLVAKVPKDLSLIVGGISKEKNFLYNSAFFIQNNKIKKTIHKSLIPSYKVFYEKRFFKSGNFKNNSISLKGKKIFVTICEDIWADENKNHYEDNPLTKIFNTKTISKKTANKKIITKKSNIDHFINISASPFTKDKFKLRTKIAKEITKNLNCSFTYVNQVGAQDELVFDGSSFHISPKHNEIKRLPSFEEAISFTEGKASKLFKHKKTNKNEDLFQALVFSVKEYFKKSGFEKAHLGLSGGIDSALVYVIAVQALGVKNVQAIALPGPHSSVLSLKLAKKLVSLHSSKIKTLDFKDTYKSVLRNYESIFDKSSFGLMHENLQARLRGLFLMTYSNQNNSLLLATSNKSELCVGYSTLYGDQCGALMPIGDLLKTEIFDMCSWYRKKFNNNFPIEIITREPSAELRPNQKDSDSLPSYDELDKAINNVITNQKSAKNELEKWVLNKSFQSEFKRWQAAPIIRVSKHSFGRGRQMPLAHNFKLKLK